MAESLSRGQCIFFVQNHFLVVYRVSRNVLGVFFPVCVFLMVCFGFCVVLFAFVSVHVSVSVDISVIRDQNLPACVRISFFFFNFFFMVPEVILKNRLNLGRCTLYPWVADGMCSSHDHVCHFIPIQFVLCWLGGVLFENSLVLHAYVHFHGGLQARWWQANIGLQSFVTRFVQATHKVAWENSFALLEVRHTVQGLYVRNKASWRNHIEASVFTPVTMSWQTLQGLNKKIATLARKMEKGKICWNCAWLEENV